MLLIARLLRSRDEGAALASVMGLMLIGAIVASLVLGTMVSAYGHTSATRANVQAQAAAQAGVTAARQALIDHQCVDGTVSNRPGDPNYDSESPEYSAEIFIAVGAGYATTPGCPASSSVGIKIVALGYAASPGVAGVSSGDIASVEAILGAAGGAVTLVGTGAALFAYNAGSLGSGGKLISSDGSTPRVLVQNGNVTCSGDWSGIADFVVDNGNVTVDGSCKVSGNMWAPDGRVTFSGSGKVGGNVIAKGLTMSAGNGAGSPLIGGKVWSSADIWMKGNAGIGGAVKATSLILDGGHLNGGGYIYGATQVINNGGSSIGAGPTGAGSILYTQSQTGAQSWWGSKSRLVTLNPISTPTIASDKPTLPVVPDWIDFGSIAGHYTSEYWVGFTPVTLSGASCKASQLQTVVNNNAGKALVIDARGCTNGVVVDGNDNVGISNDLAIIAHKISFAGSGRITGASSTNRVWLINPDATANVPPQPDCAAQSLKLEGWNTPLINVRAMLYSPCTVSITAGVGFTGQVFAGSVTMSGSSSITYVPIGLPGYDLDAGLPTGGGGGGEATRTIELMRNVTPDVAG